MAIDSRDKRVAAIQAGRLWFIPGLAFREPDGTISQSDQVRLGGGFNAVQEIQNLAATDTGTVTDTADNVSIRDNVPVDTATLTETVSITAVLVASDGSLTLAEEDMLIDGDIAFFLSDSASLVGEQLRIRDPNAPPEYAVYRVDGSTGAILGTLTANDSPTDAQVETLTFIKNGHDTARIFVPKDSSELANLAEMSITSEIRVDVEQETVFWGVPVRTSMGPEGMDLQVQGVSYYLEGRHVGESARSNLLTNGDFDTDLTGWTKVDPATSQLTGVADASVRKLGAGSIRIEGTSRAVGKRPNGDDIDSPTSPTDYAAEDRYYFQRTGSLFATATGPTICVVRAWFHIRDTGSFAYGAKPFETRGLYARTLTSGDVWTGKSWYFPITDSTPRNSWVRAEFEMLVEPTEKVEVRLYPPGSDGVTDSAVNFDAVGLFEEKQLSFYNTDFLGTDVVEIVEGLVEHSQGLSVLGQDAPADKTDVNLRGDPANSTVGTKLTLAYQWSDHENIWDAIRDFIGFDGGTDFRLTWNGAKTERYLRVDRPLGSLKTDFNLQIDGASTNIIDMDYGRDGTVVANSVIVLGDGDGPDREEGSAVDTSGLGVTWEHIERAPRDFDIDQLDELANGILADRATPCESLIVRLTDSDFSDTIVGNLLVGDRIEVTGDWGNLSMTSNEMTVQRLTVNPREGVTVLELV